MLFISLLIYTALDRGRYGVDIPRGKTLSTNYYLSSHSQVLHPPQQAKQKNSTFTMATTTSEGPQMPWVEKYRPSKLEDLVAHEDIISIITRLIDNDNLPHLLLYGPPGTGKVSSCHCPMSTFLFNMNHSTHPPSTSLFDIYRHLP